jgi:hypothetical protein
VLILSVDPNDASCSNPASVTVIKCVYWGGPVSQDSAVNKGQMRGGFTVAIAGSNGYVTNQIKTPAGYQAGVPYGKFAINAPYDAQGYNTVSSSIYLRENLADTSSLWDPSSLLQPGMQLLVLLTATLRLSITSQPPPKTVLRPRFATSSTPTS